MRTIIAILSIALLLCMPLAGTAQSQEAVDPEHLKERLEGLDRSLAAIRGLDGQLQSVSESDREAVMYRRDERALALLKETEKVARAVAELPEDNALRQDATRRLRGDLSATTDLSLKWVGELSQRIARLDEELEAEGADSRPDLVANIYSLQNLRIQFYEALGDIVDARKALDIPVAGILPVLEKMLYLHAEILAGRLVFSAAATEGLQNRLSADPKNADLEAAEKSFASDHARDLERLKAISDLLARLDLDNTAYSVLLLEQGRQLSVGDINGAMIAQYFRSGWESLQEDLVDRAPDLIFRLLMFVLVLVVFRALARMVRRAILAACDRSGVDMSTLLKSMLASVSSAAVMAMGIMIALSQVGISLGPMLAGLGVAGFIVGFALQDTLGNFAAGGMILIYRPYDVDDVVEVAGVSGLVRKMSLVSTTITTFDNQTLVVPNSKIWGDVIKNVTAQHTRRVDLEFGIGYGDDIEKAEQVLKDILDSHELVLKSPEPTIRLHTLGDSSVNFVVRPWVKTSDYWNVYWDVTREVKMRFDSAGISIPFPQQDVHIHTNSA